MKGIPTKDGEYWCRKPGDKWTEATVECGWLYTFYGSRSPDGMYPDGGMTFESLHPDLEFIPIPPPPDDGEYACVWVEVKRDADGKRTCFRCGIYEQCDKQVWMNEDNTIMLRPGPDCPLGSD